MDEIIAFPIAALTTACVVYILHPLAPRLGLLDQPGARRKIHAHAVAPIGGIAIFAGLLAGLLVLLTYTPPNAKEGFGLLGAAVLVIVGGLDDRFDLGYRARLLAQAVAALLLVLGAGAELHGLGDLFGYGPIGLGWLSVPFTVIAIVGLINAFNMIDGIDGLAGSLALIALVSLLLVAPEQQAAHLTQIQLLAIVTLLPYLAFNLELPGFRKHKIFLGDAGSMLIGYLVVWSLIETSQASQEGLPPVVALWLAAIPLMDTFAVMGRRIRKGRSPFKADHHHLHHLLTRTTGSPRKTLVIMLSIGLVMALWALITTAMGIPEYVLFYQALLVFGGYLMVQAKIPQLYRSLRRRRSNKQRGVF